MQLKPKVVVIGCGVSGLTCGICLLEADFDVIIIARDLPPQTTPR
ncbi:MAG: FAD-binding oxidoreductase [Anaerolineales bacterium]|nr:FAD-binding oxidoreductase [Anaerolineales bacterium]